MLEMGQRQHLVSVQADREVGDEQGSEQAVEGRSHACSSSAGLWGLKPPCHPLACPEVP